MIAPPAASLESTRAAIADCHIGKVVKLGVQDPWHKTGAYTGATTLEMAKDPQIGAEYAIIGHSETREPLRILFEAITRTLGDFSDAALVAGILKQAKIDAEKPRSFRLALDQIVNRAVTAALKAGITPILCVGETLEEREAEKTSEVVFTQLEKGFAGLEPDRVKRAVVAYEPVWAIGTGKNATPEEAQEVHARIAAQLMALTKTEINVVPVIYGGSMKPDNVAALVSQPDIWGGLIGGASLKPDVFMQLIINGLQAAA